MSFCFVFLRNLRRTLFFDFFSVTNFGSKPCQLAGLWDYMAQTRSQSDIFSGSRENLEGGAIIFFLQSEQQKTPIKEPLCNS